MEKQINLFYVFSGEAKEYIKIKRDSRD